MKHAVILAHPNPESLNAAIARTYVQTVEGLDQPATLRDLYRMKFDPWLRTEEIPGPNAPVFAPDVVAERAVLDDVDVFALVYPFWFNAAPGVLKGYIDRVFGMGFGFDPGFGGNRPRLAGRKLISFTTSGAPDHWVRDTGALHDLMRLFDRHLAGVCGFDVIDHVHFGGMVTGITQEAFDEVIETVRRTVAGHFKPSAPA